MARKVLTVGESLGTVATKDRTFRCGPVTSRWCVQPFQHVRVACFQGPPRWLRVALFLLLPRVRLYEGPKSGFLRIAWRNSCVLSGVFILVNRFVGWKGIFAENAIRSCAISCAVSDLLFVMTCSFTRTRPLPQPWSLPCRSFYILLVPGTGLRSQVLPWS